MNPICFVIMPFGKKNDIDFDKVYKNIIKPAIEKAEMIPLREDNEISGGIIHRAMIEKIIFSDFVIADISIDNSNVYYELGIRHMASKNNTLLITSKDVNVFDVKPVRYFKYEIEDREANNKLASRIKEMFTKSVKASPVYDFFDFKIEKEKYKKEIELFKEHTKAINEIENQLLVAKENKNIPVLENLEKRALNDRNLIKTLYLIYRDLEKYEKMLSLYDKMPEDLKENKFILEQKAFALNRLGKRTEAKVLLKDILDKFGENSETLGILGRVYKDWWVETEDNQYLKKAIETYKKGFETDLNDYYPGINLVTLAFCDENEDILNKYLPIVEVAVQKALNNKKDYWNLATMFELAFIKKNCELAKNILDKIIVVDEEKWMVESTLNNLNFLMKKVNDECLIQLKEEFEKII